MASFTPDPHLNKNCLRHVVTEWTEACGGLLDWAMWRLSGLRHVATEWTEACGG